VRLGEFEITVEDVRSRRIGRVVLRRSDKQSVVPPADEWTDNHKG
jgi:hypothetical protein